MTTIPAATLPLFDRGAIRRTSAFNRGLAFVAALYLAVAILELSIVVHAAPSLAAFGSLYAAAP
jgi:hypothetical protein